MKVNLIRWEFTQWCHFVCCAIMMIRGFSMRFIELLSSQFVETSSRYVNEIHEFLVILSYSLNERINETNIQQVQAIIEYYSYSESSRNISPPQWCRLQFGTLFGHIFMQSASETHFVCILLKDVHRFEIHTNV